jgi:hypothetical protein
MAYGALVINDSGHKVIQDASPIFALKRSGTLQPVYQGPETGWYAYDISVSLAEPTGTEEVFFELPVGGWLGHKPFFSWLGGPANGQLDQGNGQYFVPELEQYNSLWNHSSNQSSLDYYVFDTMDNIPGAGAATGYGMQVFDSSGNVTWDSNAITNRVSVGGTVSTSTITVNSTANSCSLRSHYQDFVLVNGNRNWIRGHKITRTSTTQWKVGLGFIDKGWFSRDPNNNTTAQIPNGYWICQDDGQYMLAYT